MPRNGSAHAHFHSVTARELGVAVVFVNLLLPRNDIFITLHDPDPN